MTMTVMKASWRRKTRRASLSRRDLESDEIRESVRESEGSRSKLDGRVGRSTGQQCASQPRKERGTSAKKRSNARREVREEVERGSLDHHLA